MIGYYVHHVGAGHAQRALAIADKLHSPVIAFSSMAAPLDWKGKWVHLPHDAGGIDATTADVTANETLHWAPRRHEGLRKRMGVLGDYLASGDIDVLVVDVSVEISLLARLYGVPVIVVAMPGERNDRAHQMGYDLAERLLAPWPHLTPSQWPEPWVDKTTYLGSLSRFDGRPVPQRQPTRRVLVLFGAGGLDTTMDDIRAAATATPDWDWDVIGPEDTGQADLSNLRICGWVDDVWPRLLAADVVVTHAGQNAIAEVAAARLPAIVVPQDRPFGEQRATAAELEQADIAVVSQHWPAPSDWRGLLDRAIQQDGHKWELWSFGDAGERAAKVIEGVARSS